MNELIPNLGPGSVLREMLQDGNSVRVGAVQRLDYQSAIVLTHDLWKNQAGGIAQFSFLLATAADIDGTNVDDDEVLLLRVEGTAPLSLESDLHAVREEALREALSRTSTVGASQVLDLDLDPFTKNRASFTGLRCRVIGTFYEEVVDGETKLQFGSDVDNFYATSTYRVLKPTGAGLSMIASYMRPELTHQPVRIGAVRYSATKRRAITSGQDDASVFINMHDFIGHKTGLLGMTRTGKSNTAKILIARTFIASQERLKDGQPPIGQLIFDPQGEYASNNVQDGTAIAGIGEDHVRIYQFGANGTTNVRPLGINFFDEDQIAAVQQMIATELADATAGYVADFATSDFVGDPKEARTLARASRGRFLLFASLIKAGFAMRPGFTVRVVMNKDVVAAIEAIHGNPFGTPGPGGAINVAGDTVIAVVDAIIQAKEAGNEKVVEWCDEPSWQNTEPIYTTRISGGQNTRGFRNLNTLRIFHNPDTKRDVGEEIYEDLMDGRIVIVDTHLGTPAVVQKLSADIARGLISRHTEKFTRGLKPQPVQVMLEEAHNLFSDRQYKADNGDVWVKLAKEAAKLEIGMIYATQEVTGVASQVKANTANWVVSHLNNSAELNELSRYYDFKAYADAILASEDRGYVRMKTLSSPYIVPVQIEKYDVHLVNQARAAAGIATLPVS